jgi:hypothetical protein
VPLAVAAVAGVSGALPAQAAPAIAPTTGLPASGFFVQHAVIMVNDMNANIKVCGAFNTTTDGCCFLSNCTASCLI